MVILFSGYNNPDERLALVIGAVSFLVNVVFAVALISRASHSGMQALLALIALAASGMCFLFLVAAFLAP